MTAATDGLSLLLRAEHLLDSRGIARALATFDAAERAGAEADRCAAGRWMCHMLRGDFPAAWIESDSIRARGAPDPLRFWGGEPIDGRRVMLRCLHGFGDAVQYLRWLPLLRRRAAAVTVQAAPALLPLLRHLHERPQLITWNAPGETDAHLWDVQVECAELPYLFRADTSSLPAPSRFAIPSATLAGVRANLGLHSRPRVGLVWAGSPYDPDRSLPFAMLHSLLQDNQFEFWSLQDEHTNTEWYTHAADEGARKRVVAPNDLEHLALFASQMDLVITIDTLAAHLAGSLGVPVWTLLKHAADWRWGLSGSTTCWYPSMRLFRQPSAGAWQPVLQQVQRALLAWQAQSAA